MIEIFADGKPLVLYRDTTLTIEYNNALFASEAIEGDVVYSFDIPVSGNEKALQFEHLPYVKSHKKHDCTIRVGGIDIITGKLIVQRVTKLRYSVAVMVNPYPDGFAERKMSENESREYVISPSSETHQSQWFSFLKRNVTEKRFKFAPFLNENAYGSNNENFGFWNGQKKGKIVNRLFYDALNQPVVNEDIHIFNEEIRLSESDEDSHNLIVERNQQCFAPQVSLEEMLSNFVSNAKYRFVNHMSEDIRKIYIQSPKSMDGTEMQFRSQEFIPSRAKGRVKKTQSNDVDQFQKFNIIPTGNADGLIQDNNIYIVEPGIYDILLSGNITSSPGTITLILFKGLPKSKLGEYAAEDILHIEQWEETNPEDVNGPKIRVIEKGVRVNVPAEFARQPVSLAILEEVVLTSGNHTDSNGQQEATRAEFSISITGPIKTSQNLGLNIFTDRFKIASLFPDLGNAAFANAIIKDLGMCYFIDSRSGSIEMISFRDLLESKSIDLSSYVLTNETDMEKPTDRKTLYTIKAVKSDTLTEEERRFAKETNRFNNIGNLSPRVGDIIFVRDMNAYFLVGEEQNENGVWRETYDEYAGNDKALVIGEGKEESVSSTSKVPALATTDYRAVGQGTYGNVLIPNIPMELKSVLSGNENEDKSDLVLLQYRGMKEAEIEGDSNTMRYADMNPVSAKGFSLTATGDDSLGEKYLRPYITIREQSRTITYKLRVPILKALEIIRLVQPQHEEPRSQVRCVMIDNVKSMPRKISLQIDNNDSLVLCEIEAAKLD